MTSSGSVMNLSKLHKVIRDRNLPFKIGAITPGDGNCYLSSIKQNILHCVSNGTWPSDVPVPASVDELRVMAVNQMISNKSNYVGQNLIDGRLVDGPLTNEQFNSLITSQSKLDAYCDEEGFMVAAVCKVLNVELTIVLTNITSEILRSGVGGPVQIINKSEDDNNPRLKFSVGFIRDNNQSAGHYQFIFSHPAGEDDTFVMPTESFPPPVRNRGENHILKFEFALLIILYQVSC